MAEKSLFWYTNGFTGDTGDGAAPYTQEEFRFFNAAWSLADNTAQGPVKGVLNELAVSGSSSPLAVATGFAFVYGFPYKNDAGENITVTTPSVGDTGGRVVLRANWSAQTVRLVLKTSSDGVNTVPALTQTDGTTWEIPLASFVIDTSGNIWQTSAKSVAGVTDERDYAATTLRPADGSVTTVKLADDAVDDTKAGNRVPKLTKRMGGNASDWAVAGTTTYTPSAILQQIGYVNISLGSGDTNKRSLLSFPTAFGNKPLVFATINNGLGSHNSTTAYTIEIYDIAATYVDFELFRTDTTDGARGVGIMWLAIGPE